MGGRMVKGNYFSLENRSVEYYVGLFIGYFAGIMSLIFLLFFMDLYRRFG